MGACSYCHGASGEGGSGPNLVLVSPELSDDEMYTVIVQGRGGMPGGLLNEESDIVDVMVYIRSWEE